VKTDDDARVSTPAPPLLVVAVLLALVCSALYGTRLAAELVGAADRDLFASPVLRWHELSFAHARAALASVHPIAMLSYGLNYRLGRIDLHGYHAVNAALHFVNALLVYALGRALFRRVGVSDEVAPWAALAGAAVFAAHPLQVEAVTWVAQRAGLLAALWGLAALLCHLRGRAAERRAGRAGWWGAAAACWLLALGSRETAIALPLLIWLCEWLFCDDLALRALVRRLPIAVALCGAAWLALAGAPIAGTERWLASGRALPLFESLVVWPAPARLSLVHDLGDSSVELGAALALQALLLGAAVASARRFRIFSFAVLWFLCVHAGEAAFASPPFAAEQRNYLALVGPALGGAYLVFSALPRRLGLATALSLLAVTSLGAATHARNELWLSPDRLWNDAVSKSPNDAAARIERGALLEQQGQVDEALADYREAVELAPRSAPARERLAASLAALGRERDALMHAQ
jgi:protein O-mannosyl-transferase